MAFWKKKSEDPWDRKPEKKPAMPAAVPASAPEPPAWARVNEAPEPINCPWCGAAMLGGFLYGSGRGFMQWREGPWRGGLDALRFTGWKIDLGDSEAAWYCPACQKLVMDIAGMLEKAGPNYEWKDGKIVFPEAETEE